MYASTYPPAETTSRMPTAVLLVTPTASRTSGTAVTIGMDTPIARCGVRNLGCVRLMASGSTPSIPMLSSTRTSAVAEASAQAKNDAATPQSRIGEIHPTP